MGHLMRRVDICRRLRIDDGSTSYRYIGTTRRGNGLINTDTVVDILNRSRVGEQPLISFLPSDIYTADDVMAKIDCGIDGKKLMRWCCKRTMHVPPHWKISNKIRRFQLSVLKEWLYSGASIVKIAD